MPRYGATLQLHYLYSFLHTKRRAAITASPDSDQRRYMHCTVLFHIGSRLRTFRKPYPFCQKGTSLQNGCWEANWGRVLSCILKQQQVCTYNDLDFSFLSCKNIEIRFSYNVVTHMFMREEIYCEKNITSLKKIKRAGRSKGLAGI